VAGFAELVSTRWEMPAQLLPPESFGPCAIAGEKFTAVSKASVAPASNRVFIAVLRVFFERKFKPRDSAATIQRTAAPPFDSRGQINRRRASGNLVGWHLKPRHNDVTLS
jgi:hypothetical protein